jgi:hypothetical protein
MHGGFTAYGGQVSMSGDVGPCHDGILQRHVVYGGQVCMSRDVGPCHHGMVHPYIVCEGQSP